MNRKHINAGSRITSMYTASNEADTSDEYQRIRRMFFCVFIKPTKGQTMGENRIFPQLSPNSVFPSTF